MVNSIQKCDSICIFTHGIKLSLMCLVIYLTFSAPDQALFAPQTLFGHIWAQIWSGARGNIARTAL